MTLTRAALTWILKRRLEQLAVADAMVDLAPYIDTLNAVTSFLTVDASRCNRVPDALAELVLRLDYEINSRAETQARAIRVTGDT
jgi:hypothetical protein